MTGTADQAGVTNGERGVTSGGMLGRLVAVAVPLAVIVQVSINAASRVADGQAAGRPIGAGEAWGYELTSGVAILLLLPLVWRATGRITPTRVGWPRCLAGHVLGSLIFSTLHIAMMLALRFLVWGERYDAGPIGDLFLYEYRKDAWSYVVIVLVFVLARRLAVPVAAPSSSEDRLLVVQDGTRRHHVRIDAIRYVRAAGNYVEVVIANETLLHRATLLAIEAELGDAFVRIHRGVLVARSNVATIKSTPAGDFTVMTRCGDVLKGSRRFRADIAS